VILLDFGITQVRSRCCNHGEAMDSQTSCALSPRSCIGPVSLCLDVCPVQHGSSGMSPTVIHNVAPLQATIVDVEEAEPQAYLAEHLVDWVAHCGAASVLLGVIGAMNHHTNIGLIFSVGHVQFQRATTLSPTSHPIAANAAYVFLC